MPMRIRAIVAVLPLLALLSATNAHSQNRGTEPVPPARSPNGLDSPSAGISRKPLYWFSGIRDGNAGPWAFGTAVMCSNGSAQPINVRLRIFGYSGTAYATVDYTVPPFNTHTAVTRSIPTYVAQLNLNLSAVSQGLGYILSDRPNLYCTAQVIDALNAPPTFIGGLHMERLSFQ